MTRAVLTGDKDIERMLVGLSDKAADRVSVAALSAGLVVVRREIRKAAPVGKTGNLKRSIRTRNEKNKHTGVRTAKAGVNVGKQRESTVRAPHSHLVALGTTDRVTTSGASRGRMPANDFVRRGTAAAQGQIKPAMITRAKKAVEKEVAKLRKAKR